ncbi:hypothetical protein ABH931_004767 [Streptacidiphilus sp. MAP12-33]|uniref:SsgA family sporulation/cell division regulator n=1 Tax=Streptacidiphilus sp. MAP12-33 TaxID=3156266 RepID=UPI0035171F4A
MAHKSPALRSELTAVLITGPCRPARLDLRYDPDEGFAVVLRIRAAIVEAEPLPTSWRLSRDLLDEGLRTPAGIGDVRVRPLSEDWTLIELLPPGVRAVLVVSAVDLRRFLGETFRLVPRGEDGCAVDWDAALRALGA